MTYASVLAWMIVDDHRKFRPEEFSDVSPEEASGLLARMANRYAGLADQMQEEEIVLADANDEINELYIKYHELLQDLKAIIEELSGSGTVRKQDMAQRLTQAIDETNNGY